MNYDYVYKHLIYKQLLTVTSRRFGGKELNSYIFSNQMLTIRC